MVPITTLDETIQYDVVEPIKTIPTMAIAKFDIKAAIFGQGLAGEVDWDGTITVAENVSKISIDAIGIGVKPVKASVSTTTRVPTTSVVSETLKPIKLDDIGFEITAI